MPLPLNGFKLTDSLTTQAGWRITLPISGIGTTVYLNNISNTEFQVFDDTGKYILTIPAGLYYIPVYLSYPTTILELRPLVLLIDNTLQNYVGGMQFAPREKVPPLAPVAVARAVGGTVAVQGVVTLANSTAIIAAGQTDGITTQFETGAGLIAQDQIDIRPTVNDTGRTHGLMLDSYDGAAFHHELSAYGGITILGAGGLAVANGGLAVNSTIPGQAPTSLAGGKITNINGEVTQGVLGVPTTSIIALLQNINVLTTVNTVNFTPTANAFYRINVTVRINNGTPGSAITVLLTYRDAGGVQSANLKFMRGNVEALAAGVTSFANGTWAGEPLAFYATTAGALTLSYQNPANTPNDFVSAVLERLA